jgi:pimeloyl-ACP methyl ester carboxylesterase
MPRIRLDEGLSLHCAIDDYLWPWEEPTPVLMLHGFARNATFWNRWVPAIADSRRAYRPDLLGCGASDTPAADYRFTPEKIAAQVLGGARRLVAAASALDRRIIRRTRRPAARRGPFAAHREPRAVQHTDAISNEIKGIYSLDQDSTAAAIRAYGTGEWCRRTLGYRLDLDRASAELREWCIAEMDKTTPDTAAALHECFEGVDVVPILSGIEAPVLLLSGDKSQIASEQQKILADTLPCGRLELFDGYGHGVNLLQPERCARAALDFWRAVEADRR